MLSRLLIAALRSPAEKGLTRWLLFVMFNCVFVTFPYGILGQVRYLIVLIPDLCHLSYFFILAGNEDNHKDLDEFGFLQYPITNYWVSCPRASEKSMVYVMSTLAPSVLIGSLLFLQIKRAAIKSWLDLKFGKIGPGSAELANLECFENSHSLITG